MKSWLNSIEASLKYTIFHPQWLSNRYHKSSRMILKNLDQATVLEIGSGNSKLASLINPSNELVTLDYPVTGERYGAHPNIFADATELPVKDSSIDVALMLEVAEHIPHDTDSIKEVYRVLKPSGKFYFSVPFIYPMHDQPHDYRRYTLHGVKKLLTDNGFNIEKITQHGNSVISALQLLNLCILEICKKALDKNLLIGTIFTLLLYPICLLINVVAYPNLALNSINASCFGYFIVAKK